MKPVQITVVFFANVPDDVNIDSLYLDAKIEDLRVGQPKSENELGLNDCEIVEFETVDVTLGEDDTDID